MFDPIWLQIIFIISLPALIGVKDLVLLGKGTPFPYDQTKYLVRNGAYAYCRNPIQWAFTLIFIPLSIYYESWYFLVGAFISIFYTIGVSDVQEYPDMEKRFGNSWKEYIKLVPRWYFQWKPNGIEKAEIYFDDECKLCWEVKKWLDNKETTNLTFRTAKEYIGEELMQVTYVTEGGENFSSVEAIAYAFGHINLSWAFIGWFMRFPVIQIILQLIIDANGLGEKCDEHC